MNYGSQSFRLISRFLEKVQRQTTLAFLGQFQKLVLYFSTQHTLRKLDLYKVLLLIGKVTVIT